MATKGHEQEAIKVEGMQHSFQKFKNDIIGIPNVTDAVYYTQAEAEAYNAALTGALDDETPLTAEQAAAYNEAITGAAKEAGDTLSTAEANAYNATLDGAVSTTDVKTAAVPTKVKDYVDGRTPVMTGASDSAAGAKGLVPAPAAGDENKLLRGDGTWADQPLAAFVGETLVFYSGGAFSGETLVLG